MSIRDWLRRRREEQTLYDRRMTTYNVGPGGTAGAGVVIPPQRPIGVGEGERFVADRAAARLMRSSAEQLGKPVPTWVHELADATSQHHGSVRSADAPPRGTGVHAQRSDKQYSLWRDDTINVWEHWPSPAAGKELREVVSLTAGQMLANLRSRRGHTLPLAALREGSLAYVAWHRERSPDALTRLRGWVRHMQATDLIEHSPEVAQVMSQPNPGQVLKDLGIPAEQVDAIPPQMLTDLVTTFVAARSTKSDPEMQVMQAELERVLEGTNRQLLLMTSHHHESGLHVDLTETITIDLPDSEASRRGR